jgi:hypothetical protein
VKKEMLATALHVNAYLTSTTEYVSVVARLYVSREDQEPDLSRKLYRLLKVGAQPLLVVLGAC